MEYLKIVSELDMFATSYFEVKLNSSSPTSFWLGIHPVGIKIFSYEQKLQAQNLYKWNEINDILVKLSKLTIKYFDSSKQKKSSMTFHIQRHQLYSKWVCVNMR